MSTTEVARMLKAKRIGKNKWRASCPIHGGRYSGPVFITNGKDGGVWMHCFGGCTQEQLLYALGLKWSDLLASSPIDPEIQRQIAMAEAKHRAEKDHRTSLLWLARTSVEFWHTRSQQVGASLAQWPDEKLARDFHHALYMERRAQKVWETL